MYQKLFLLLLIVLLAGIGLAPGSRQTASSIGQVPAPPRLEFGSALLLAEPDEILLVKPRVTLDPRGGYFVADAKERQIRRYNQDGTLDRVISRRGDGPGEVRQPVSVFRLPNQQIVGVDIRGRIAIYDERGETLVETQTVPLSPIYSAGLLDDSTLVLAARTGDSDDSRLGHLWDLKRQKVLRSFGPVPPHRKELEGAYALNGSASVAVRDGKIALLFALADTVWLFDARGDALRSVPLRWKRYRQLETPMPTAEAPEAFDRWLGTFTVGGSVFWWDDHSLVVQFLDVDGDDRIWSIVGVSDRGEPLFEFYDQPRLLTVSPANGQLLFINPASDFENSWVPAFVR